MAGTDGKRDPRQIRTRVRVLAEARSIIAEHGASALTYSLLSRRTGITRPTLYQHWSSITDMVTDLMMEGPPSKYPEPGSNAREVITAFLHSFRAGMSDPATAAVFTSLISQAEHQPDASTALHELAEDRLAALNILLVPAGVTVTSEQMSSLIGPIIYRRFVHRKPADNLFIDNVVAAHFAK